MIPLSRQTSRKSSTSTTLSAISTASGKRIEPMFNLQVHNVVHPTIVTDAATDVKVAKVSDADASRDELCGPC